MPYRPKPMDQPNSLTCVDTSTAMLLDRITVGRLRPNPLTIRRATGVSGRGISYGEAAYAVSKLYGITLSPRYGLTRDQVHAVQSADRPFVRSIHTYITRSTTRRTGSFIGSHSVFDNEYDWRGGSQSCRCERNTSVDHGEDLIEDPGTFSIGWLWWSTLLANRASEYRTGGNGINILLGPDTEGVYRRVRVDSAPVRSDPDSSSKSKGRVYRDQSVYVIKTLNGVPRSDGRDGWHQVKFGSSSGYVRGDALR